VPIIETLFTRDYIHREKKPFDAGLKFDENFKVVFDFPEKKGKK